MRLLTALRSKLGDYSEHGDELDFECPQCLKADGKRKLGINLTKKKFNCFRCGYSGTLRDLLSDLSLDATLLGRGATAGPAVSSAARESTTGRDGGISGRAIPGFLRLSTPSPRGRVEEEARIMAEEKGRVSWEEMVNLGWGISTDPSLAGRLIVPVYYQGQLQNYLARSVPSMMLTPKELSGSEADGWEKRSNVALGVDEVKVGEICVLVEGLWDKKWLDKASNSFKTVAVLGHNLHPTICGRIITREPSKIVVFYDGDEAGVEGTFQTVNYLLERNWPEVKVARPPEGKDPNELTDSQILSLIATAQPGPVWMAEQAARDGKGGRRRFVPPKTRELGRTLRTQLPPACRWKDRYRE